MLLPVLLNYDRGCIKRVTTSLCGVQGVRGIRKIEQRLNIQKISTWNVVIVGFSFGRNKHRHTKVDCLNLIEMLHGVLSELSSYNCWTVGCIQVAPHLDRLVERSREKAHITHGKCSCSKKSSDIRIVSPQRAIP